MPYAFRHKHECRNSPRVEKASEGTTFTNRIGFFAKYDCEVEVISLVDEGAMLGGPVRPAAKQGQFGYVLIAIQKSAETAVNNTFIASWSSSASTGRDWSGG